MTPAGSSQTRLLLLLALLLLALGGCAEKTADEFLKSAQSHMAQRQTDAAVLEVKNLLQLDPGSAPGRWLLGKLLYDAGEMAAAEAEFRRALDAGHDKSSTLPLLAEAMLTTGRSKPLLSQFGTIDLPDAQADAQLKVHLAAAAAQGGDLMLASRLLDQAQRRAVDPTIVDLQRARFAAAGGDRAGALAQVQALLDRNPEHADALALKGNLLAEGGQTGNKLQAIAAWRQSLSKRPDNLVVHASVVAALMEQRDWPAAATQLATMKQLAPNHSLTLYHDALLAEHRGDAQRMRNLAQTLLRRGPDNVSALMLAGRAELRLGAPVRAEPLFARAMRLAPDLPSARRWLAQSQVRGGQVDRALLTLAPLLDAKSPDVEALLIAAQVRLQLADTTAADALLARAAKLSPDDLRVRTALAISQLAKRRDPAAYKALEDIAAKDSNPAADLAIIRGRMRDGALDDALKAIETLARKTPDDPQPEYLRGQVALQKKDPAAAREHYQRALKLNPDFMPALMALTTLDLVDKRPDDARKRLEEVVQRNGRNVAVMIVLAELNDRTGGSADQTVQWLSTAVSAAPTDPMPRIKLVDQLLKLQRLEAAEQAIQAAVASFPSDLDLLSRLGQVQQKRGDSNQAVVTFTRLVTMLPKSPEPLLRLAEAQAANNELPKAAASVRAAVALAPDDPAALRAAALLAMSEGRTDQALSLARKLQGPQPAAGLLLEGDIAAQQGRWAVAVAAYRRALALVPQTDTVLRLHQALQASGLDEEAQRLATAWRKSSPKDLAFLVALGDRSMSRRQWAQAEESYRAVLAANPTHLLALNNLAYLLVVQNKPGGLALAEQAVKLAPDPVHFQDTLAFCLAADKQLARAIEVQTQVVERAPGVPEYRLQLARFHLKAGDKAAALAQLQPLEALGKRFPRQAEVTAMLRSART